MSKHYEPYGEMLDPDLACSRLKESGARMTAQRRAVIEILWNNRTHPTAEALISQVEARLGCVSPATVYNTLEALEDLGFVRRIDGLDSRAHFDPDTSEHQHAICRQCRKVWDITYTQEPEGLPDGFRVEEVLAQGMCPDCIIGS
jgi:Fur family peroxide stress response transcriptional regulator